MERRNEELVTISCVQRPGKYMEAMINITESQVLIGSISIIAPEMKLRVAPFRQRELNWIEALCTHLSFFSITIAGSIENSMSLIST